MKGWMQRTASLVTCGGWLMALIACGPKQVQPVKNVERAVTMWDGDKTPSGQAHLCLEYSTAAEKLHDREANASIPVGETPVTLGYKDAESLANIYSVSEIMQFGHAALYRLCEASGNQAIDETTYKALFADSIAGVHDLIELQLLREKVGSIEHLMVLRSEFDRIDERRCGLARSNSAAAARELLSLNARRRELEKRISELSGALNTERVLGALPTEDTLTHAQFETLDQATAEVIQARNAVEPGKSVREKKDVARAALSEGGAASPVTDWVRECTELQQALGAAKDGACVGDFIATLEECP